MSVYNMSANNVRRGVFSLIHALFLIVFVIYMGTDKIVGNYVISTIRM